MDEECDGVGARSSWVRDRSGDGWRVLAVIGTVVAVVIGISLAPENWAWLTFVALVCLQLLGRGLSGAHVHGARVLVLSGYHVRLVSLGDIEAIEVVERRFGFLAAVRTRGRHVTVRGATLAWRTGRGAWEVARGLEAALAQRGFDVPVVERDASERDARGHYS